MKKTINLITTLSIIVALALSACSGSKVASKANSLKDDGKLVEALELINTAVDSSNPEAAESLNDPKTWETRGDIYKAIYQSKDEAVKNKVNDPLSKAWESYQKAISLDEKGSLEKSMKIKLTLLTNDLTNQAVEAFQNNNFDKALSSFEQRLEIQNTDFFKKDNPEMIDTAIIFNAGLAAYNAKNYDKAIEYFEEAGKYGYNGAKTPALASNAYQLKGDTVGALNVLQNAFKKYPEDNTVLTSMIQLYLDTDKSDEAMKYLKLAIEKDPNNPRLHFAKGTLYEKLKEPENAIKAYEKAIEVDPNNFNAYYNLGAVYYNQGVEQMEVARAVPSSDNDRYLEESKKANVYWEKAIPYMEKAHEVNPEDQLPLQSLKNLYYRLKMMDKYNEVLEKLGEK